MAVEHIVTAMVWGLLSVFPSKVWRTGVESLGWEAMGCHLSPSGGHMSMSHRLSSLGRILKWPSNTCHCHGVVWGLSSVFPSNASRTGVESLGWEVMGCQLSPRSGHMSISQRLSSLGRILKWPSNTCHCHGVGPVMVECVPQ